MGLLLLVFVAVSASGCFSSLRVIRQAPDNPLVGTPSFALVAPTFNNLHVNGVPEAEYVKTLKAETQTAWDGDKAKIAEAFTKVLMDASGVDTQPIRLAEDAAFQLRVNIDWIEPGFYTYWNGDEGRIKMRVAIRTRGGKLVDEIEIETTENASLYYPAIRDRLRRCGLRAGEEVVRYLEERQR